MKAYNWKMKLINKSTNKVEESNTMTNVDTTPNKIKSVP
jgi:hypothetical protein